MADVSPLHHAANAAAALRSGASIRVRVTGRSMRPAVQPGDEVHVRPGRPQTGEVVLILDQQHGALILHRLIGRVKLGGLGWALHAGDAPGAPPYLCREDQLLGVATLARRDEPATRRSARLTMAVLRVGARKLLGLCDR